MGYYKVDKIIEFHGNQDLIERPYLVLSNPHKVPPHISLIKGGIIYSLTVKGSLIEQADLFIKAIYLKKTPTLFFELKSNAANAISVEHLFNSYPKVIAGKVSCLFPIREYFQEFYSIDKCKVKFVFDLLPLLEEKLIVRNAYHLNMSPYLNDNEFILNHYSEKDINDEIIKLNSLNQC